MGEVEKALTNRINEEHRRCERAIHSMLEHAVACGQMLEEAKAEAGHGNWLPWLRENFDGSERIAQAYMKVARGQRKLNPQRVADMSLREALIEIAEPQRGTSAENPAVERERALFELVLADSRLLSGSEEARHTLVGHLDAALAVGGDPALSDVRDRIDRRSGGRWDPDRKNVFPVPLAGDERSLLRMAFPDLLSDVEGARKESEALEKRLDEAERNLLAKDLLPSRETFFIWDALDDQEMNTTMADLRKEGRFRRPPFVLDDEDHKLDLPNLHAAWEAERA